MYMEVNKNKNIRRKDYRFRSFLKVSFRNMPLGSAPDFFN